MRDCGCTAYGPCPICRQPCADATDIVEERMDPVTRGWLVAICLVAVICLLALIVATGVAMGTLTR